MKATETKILNFIGGLDKAFIIPPFQRNYEWGREQCSELFNDILHSCKSNKAHYLGNVVYYEGENNGAFIFDGRICKIFKIHKIPPCLSTPRIFNIY